MSNSIIIAYKDRKNGVVIVIIFLKYTARFRDKNTD